MTEAARPGRSAIERLLNPRSVAVVGASATPGSLAGAVLGNLDRFAFTGDVHLVNANRQEINGRPCLPSAADLPQGVDCAVLTIPRAGIDSWRQKRSPFTIAPKGTRRLTVAPVLGKDVRGVVASIRF